jgi:hypothetical protein
VRWRVAKKVLQRETACWYVDYRCSTFNRALTHIGFAKLEELPPPTGCRHRECRPSILDCFKEAASSMKVNELRHGVTEEK